MNKNLKIFATFLPILVIGIFVAPGRADDEIGPTSVSCWFFRGDRVELKQTCTYRTLWDQERAGAVFLRWQDGVETRISWGYLGDGNRPCEDRKVDNVCGIGYFRDPTSLKRISQEESQKRGVGRPIVNCILLPDKSICWLR